jgi:hypothetical protein
MCKQLSTRAVKDSLGTIIALFAGTDITKFNRTKQPIG